MLNREYWNYRNECGIGTKIDASELHELNWRVLATLLERFEDNIDDACDEEYLSKLSSDYNSDNETYGKFLCEGCLRAASEVFGINTIEGLASSNENARKSNIYYKMAKEVWEEVVGTRDAPRATSLDVEKKKNELASYFYRLLFNTAPRKYYSLIQEALPSLDQKQLQAKYLELRSLFARHSNRDDPEKLDSIKGVKEDLSEFGEKLSDLIPKKLLNEIYSTSNDQVIVKGDSFSFPIELLRKNNQYLATRHSIIRQFSKKITPKQIKVKERPIKKILYISDPSKTLPYESVESVFFSEVLKPSFNIDVELVHEMTTEEFCYKLSSSEYDLVHFTGHGHYDVSSSESLLMFSDGYLSGNDLLSIPISRPPRLVILNACSSAIDASLVQDTESSIHSLAKAFVVKGVESIIGTIWPIADSSAALFATNFYRYFFNCQVNAYKALLLTKRQFLISEDTIDMAGYVLYTIPESNLYTLRKEWAISELG